ncbi:hypothetical protein, partial [Pseudomonas marginalis]|uniref:hypothetical protein n=2 Tax=Pseudomonas TaxID=286 RepID=UPI0039E18F7F
LILHNSLFSKEFYVSTAPEVGRIIDVQDLPSTFFFIFLSYKSKTPKNAKAGPKEPAFCLLSLTD